MISLRENCKEGKGQKETLGAETESCSEPRPSTPKALHHSIQINGLCLSGKCLHHSASRWRQVLFCGLFRERLEQTWETYIQEEIREPVLCLGTKHEDLMEQTQKWRKPPSVALSWRPGCVPGDTLCSNSLGHHCACSLANGTEVCLSHTERSWGKCVSFILLDKFMTERNLKSEREKKIHFFVKRTKITVIVCCLQPGLLLFLKDKGGAQFYHDGPSK